MLGAFEGASVGRAVGALLGAMLGLGLGDALGLREGLADGDSVSSSQLVHVTDMDAAAVIIPSSVYFHPPSAIVSGPAADESTCNAMDVPEPRSGPIIQ